MCVCVVCSNHVTCTETPVCVVSPVAEAQEQPDTPHLLPVQSVWETAHRSAAG